MVNRKAVRIEITSKIHLDDILNKLISERKQIIEVITTKVNGYGILTEVVIIYKYPFSFFNRNVAPS